MRLMKVVFLGLSIALLQLVTPLTADAAVKNAKKPSSRFPITIDPRCGLDGHYFSIAVSSPKTQLATYDPSKTIELFIPLPKYDHLKENLLSIPGVESVVVEPHRVCLSRINGTSGLLFSDSYLARQATRILAATIDKKPFPPPPQPTIKVDFRSDLPHSWIIVHINRKVGKKTAPGSRYAYEFIHPALKTALSRASVSVIDLNEIGPHSEYSLWFKYDTSKPGSKNWKYLTSEEEDRIKTVLVNHFHWMESR